MAGQARTTVEDLRRRLDRVGRLAAVRSDRRKAKALSWLLDHVDLVDEEGNAVARDDLQVDFAAAHPNTSTASAGEGDAQIRDPQERGSEGVAAEEQVGVEADS